MYKMESISKKIPKEAIGNHTYWGSMSPGIPDEYFERTENVPITKQEIRSIIINRARLHSGNCILEVGSGSGSVTVEVAIQLGQKGIVTTIDHDENAVKLTKKNLVRFGFDYMTKIVHGDAVDVIIKKEEEEEPVTKYQAVIIGGTGGDTANIIKACSDQLIKGGRMVISTIQIETLSAVLDTLYNMQFKEIDVTQATISKSRKTSSGTMMLARNPVTIVSATQNSDTS